MGPLLRARLLARRHWSQGRTQDDGDEAKCGQTVRQKLGRSQRLTGTTQTRAHAAGRVATGMGERCSLTAILVVSDQLVGIRPRVSRRCWHSRPAVPLACLRERAIPARPAKRRRCAWSVKTGALGRERCGGRRARRGKRAARVLCGGSAAGNISPTTLARVFATRRCARATMRRHPAVSCGDRRGRGRSFSGASL
jgi:hypothetical protein